MGVELLTTKEVENLVQLNRVTIYRLIREAGFPAVKVGGQWRFPLDEVEAWLEERGRLAALEAAPEGLAAPERLAAPESGALAPETPTPARPDVPPMAGPDPVPGVENLLAEAEVQALLTAFAEAAGLSVLLTGHDGQTLVECPHCRHPFCEFVHETTGGEQEACLMVRAGQSGQEGLLGCAAGLCYLQAPVEVDARVVANVVMGPILDDTLETDAIRAKLETFAQEINVDCDQLMQQFEGVQRFSKDTISVLVDLLGQAVSAMVQVTQHRATATLRLKEIASLVSDVT